MPWQLVYTSAPRGLLSGQTGFCTVGRSADLREALAQRLEQLSYYHYLRVAEAHRPERNPTVCAFRILDLRGTRYQVLTRIQPCGLDFTARTNHLAQHVVFQGNELNTLPSPALLLRDWPGWIKTWDGEPRLLPDPSLESFAAVTTPCLPAQTWLELTGDAGRAAGLLEGECVRGCYLVCPPDTEAQVLSLYCETLQLLNIKGEYPLRPWRHPFTTFLQAEDNPADFHWRACQDGTPAHQQAVKRTATMIPLRAVRVPPNSLVKLAREGLKPPPPPADEGSAAARAVTLRQPEERKPGVFPPDPTHQASYWNEPERAKGAKIEGHRAIPPATWAALGVFAVVLMGLCGTRLWLGRRHHPATPQTVVETQPNLSEKAPAKTARSEKLPPAVALDANELSGWPAEEPAYIFPTGDLHSISLPVDSILRLQNLLQRYDLLEIRPADIDLTLTTNRWDAAAGAPMTVQSRTMPVLTAETDGGIECSLDYTSWKGDNHSPIVIHSTFPHPPQAFALRFRFAGSAHGEPFRLLFVNETNAPEAVRLGLRWLNESGESLGECLQPPLSTRLLGGCLLPPGGGWELAPFVHAPAGSQAYYLYKDWPARERPEAGRELDFAAAKSALAAELAPLQKQAAALAQRVTELTAKAGLNYPLGDDLDVKREKMRSLAAYAGEPAPADFVEYLNALKKHAGRTDWPRFYVDDDPGELTRKLQQIHDLWPKPTPGTNYFAQAWETLKATAQWRQEVHRVKDSIDSLQRRAAALPESIEQTAYVGLYLERPARPGLEMIRFQGP
jgi:hypothetical protein